MSRCWRCGNPATVLYWQPDEGRFRWLCWRCTVNEKDET